MHLLQRGDDNALQIALLVSAGLRGAGAVHCGGLHGSAHAHGDQLEAHGRRGAVLGHIHTPEVVRQDAEPTAIHNALSGQGRKARG